MTISIQPATTQDAPDMVSVGTRAFADDLMNQAFFDPRKATPEQYEEFMKWRVERTHKRMGGLGALYFKAMDDSTGALLGVIGIAKPVEGQSGPDADHALQATVTKPDFVNAGASEEMMKKQEEMNKKWVGDRKDVWCKYHVVGLS